MNDSTRIEDEIRNLFTRMNILAHSKFSNCSIQVETLLFKSYGNCIIQIYIICIYRFGIALVNLKNCDLVINVVLKYFVFISIMIA